MLRFSLLLFSAALLYGQQFEAATIKQPPPPDGNRMFIGINGGPGTADPGRINYENVSLKMLLMKAYGVQDYQISGPDWLNSERFNIVAKLPDGATKEQFMAMLQNLLSERFKLAVHREKKDLPGYALLVAKNGPKFKASVPDSAGDAPAPPAGPPPMGRIGKDGEVFKVGAKYTFKAEHAGILSLGVGIPLEYASQGFPGQYSVKVVIRPHP